jgi:hypothetical protein
LPQRHPYEKFLLIGKSQSTSLPSHQKSFKFPIVYCFFIVWTTLQVSLLAINIIIKSIESFAFLHLSELHKLCQQHVNMSEVMLSSNGESSQSRKATPDSAMPQPIWVHSKVNMQNLESEPMNIDQDATLGSHLQQEQALKMEENYAKPPPQPISQPQPECQPQF